ncbi:MFS transporter [Paraburkholderia youngii]|uniref:MFS transporter n=1 Tax=Paraburkholderia youngii TaxID=2782701 RepID=A0A7Y6MZI1_9BURK|nr:MFS transporter [Paraburkholderia youngii]NUY00349.1 MFS transporter [Paraburkholderia youngii]
MQAYLAVALVFMINMAGTTLPTAIYHDYQTAFGFSPATITVIFASYAVGVLGALLTIGNWSDQLGRNRMLMTGLAASAVSAPHSALANVDTQTRIQIHPHLSRSTLSQRTESRRRSNHRFLRLHNDLRRLRLVPSRSHLLACGRCCNHLAPS